MSTKITIALTRELGSLGTEVAGRLAQQLGLTIIDSEIVASKVAGRLGVEEETVLRYVDGTPSLLERMRINRRKLSRYTAEEILCRAQHGDVLIRGWGAAPLLQGIPQVISVRVCAPMDFRVKVIMQRLGVCDAEVVRREIERYDAMRARTMRAIFNVDREDMRLYHLVLNTDRLSIDACVKLVCEMVQNTNFRDFETAGTTIGDRLLEAKIQSAFTEQVSLAMAPLGLMVSAANGRITLAGISSSGSLRAKAEMIVRGIAGARLIDNRILSVPSRGSHF
jgi:cytidylate kinase